MIKVPKINKNGTERKPYTRKRPAIPSQQPVIQLQRDSINIQLNVDKSKWIDSSLIDHFMERLDNINQRRDEHDRLLNPFGSNVELGNLIFLD